MTTANIQTDFVVDILTEVQTEQEENTAWDLVFQLVDLNEFIKMFNQYHPTSADNPEQVWHAFFGNAPSGYEEGKNQEVRYLTTDSCEIILKHYQLFKSGMDFTHLPSGFFLTKNPYAGGVRDVLHYSDFLAQHNPQTNPLAVIVASKAPSATFDTHEFLPPRAQWYEFLRSKMQSATTTYCTEKELKKAFITFSNTLSRLQLEFTVPDFSKLDAEFNPIVLLGRWDTVLTQPNLKKADAAPQLQALLKLNLSSGYGAMRAISDYQGSERPCGFLVPEMFEPKSRYWYGDEVPQFHNLRSIDNVKSIYSLSDFWRYIAYQPQRNSLSYYQQGLASIEKMALNPQQKTKMWTILAGSSTGRAHFSKTVAEEKNELRSWQLLCELVDDITSVTLTMKAIAKALSAEQIKNDFIYHLERLQQLPNVPFLHSMALCIQAHIQAINPLTAPIIIAAGGTPLQSLVDLSDKLDSLIQAYGADFYAGARFYFVDGQWNKLGVQEYVELQYHMREKTRELGGWDAPFASTFVAYLSTFSIVKRTEVDELIALLSTGPMAKPKDLEYCLSLFNDVNRQCSKADLLKIIADINNRPQAFDSLMPILEYVETQFKNSFPGGYFERKKQQLLDTQFGLNEEQITAVHNLNFPAEQAKRLISIESALVRNNSLITSAELNELNEHFVNLSRLITTADFTQLLEKLDSVREQLPLDSAILGDLIKLLSKQRSVTDFGQIYYCNQIEKCTDNSLISKFIVFIDTIKPMAKTLGTISTPAVQELLAALVLNADLATIQKENFTTKIEEICAVITTVSTAHPHLQQHLLDALSNISDKHSANYFNNVIKFIECIQQINAILPAGEDEIAQQNMLNVYALFANFHQTPMELIELWEKITVLPRPEQQKFILVLVNKLIENEQDVSDLRQLINKLVMKPALFDLLVQECSNPPYPSINIINGWLEQDNFQEQYQNYSMKPYGDRRLDFAFVRRDFNKQKPLFNGVAPELFTHEVALALDKQLKANRNASVQTLRQQFVELRGSTAPLNEQQKLSLLCLCVEMLARTAAQLDDGIPPKVISQELNTTQVMALYAMLTQSKTKLISEIETGEGKSRIKMILAACQVAQGKTVDFMTSDMSLAERDFLTYNAFFTSLGIRTSLVSLNTPKQLYQKAGVNFTDNSQLLLLRNRSDILQEPFAFLEEDPEKRCLLIDEVDKFMHDKAKDSYNYASASKTLKGFIWIYPLLVDFVRSTKAANPNKPIDAASLSAAFVDFVAIHDVDELHQASVSSLNEHHQNQLITWLNSADTALQMREDNDYKVIEDKEDKLVRVRDADGYTRYTRKILVLDNGRPVEGSTFALGVHQCLCAIENQKAEKEAFVILPENETQRSSYPVTFMAQYEQGAIFGASGTTRHEAPTANSLINYEDYAYLVVPRQKELRREEKNVWLAKDEPQQIEFIKRSLREKLSENPPRPVLLICKNDQQSKLVYDALMSDTKLQALVTKCTRVHGLTEKKDEVNAIKEAGKAGTITISTVGMFGRGVDINAANLFVEATYVPSFEDEKQIKGRTGRAGKPGEYRMVLNMSDPDCPLDGSTYNIDNELDKAQKSMALQAVNQEEIAKLYAGFLENVHQNFLISLADTPKPEQLNLLQTWQKHLSDLQKAWDSKRLQLLDSIEHGNEKEFIDGFSDFAREWEAKATFINKETQKSFSPEKAATIYAALHNQSGFFKPERKAIKTQRKYDVGDDGQARIYSSLFAREFATLRGERAWFADFRAWKDGRGDLFPDLMATLRGERPIFANLRATITRLIAELKAWVTPNAEDKKVPTAEPELPESPDDLAPDATDEPKPATM